MIAVNPIAYLLFYMMYHFGLFGGDIEVLKGKEVSYRIEFEPKKWQAVEGSTFDAWEYCLNGEKGRVSVEIAAEPVPKSVEFLADQFVSQHTSHEQDVVIKKIEPFSAKKGEMTLAEFELRRYGVTFIIRDYYKIDANATITLRVILQKEFLDRYAHDIDLLINSMDYS